MDTDPIQLIVAACGCDAVRARALLRMGKNNPQAAISYYNKTLRVKSTGQPTATPSVTTTSNFSSSLSSTQLPSNKTEDRFRRRPTPSSRPDISGPLTTTVPTIVFGAPEDQHPKPANGAIGDLDSKTNQDDALPSLTVGNLRASGLGVVIPTGRLVSRPSSPAPSSSSQADTDPPDLSDVPSQEKSGKIVAQEPEVPQNEGHNDDPLEAQKTKIEERRAEQARKKLEAKKAEQAKESHQCWNFKLPQLADWGPLPENEASNERYFDILHLASAVQNGQKEDKIAEYLKTCDKPLGAVDLTGQQVENFPLMFYAVEKNNEKMVQLFTRYGGDVRCFALPSCCHQIPLLGFAIINALRLELPTTAMIATLLSLGASAEVIPKSFYDPFTEDLPVNGPPKDKLTDLDATERSWCESKDTRKHLAKYLDLTQRYYLYKSTIIPRPTKRNRQITQIQNAEPLWEVPYLLIGQILAARMVMKHLLKTLVQRKQKPTVLVFAGPSGHGKTELARKLEYLLNLKMEVVDCTTFPSESGLFGPRKGLQGNQEGTALNRFLVDHDGERAIVFMDEFEKTGSSVHNALLVPFAEGKYEDRRNEKKVDCSKIIWILATNEADPVIMKFWDQNHELLQPDCLDEDGQNEALHRLSKDIEDCFQARFRPPLTGRVTGFIPFLPFTSGEQAVGAHKFLIDFVREIRKPVKIRPDKQGHRQLLGNIRLRLPNDASLCKYLVEKKYNKDTGIRSLQNATELVEDEVISTYLNTDELVVEDSEVVDYRVNLVEGKKILVVPV